jgi:phosphatidylserine/phosphatidylglycerophosphate/cardiolipin synthase-like enzyme
MKTAQITIPDDWAEALRRDVLDSQASIVISALSMLPPRLKQLGPWGQLWAALLHAAERSVRIEVSLPAVMRAHPATSSNATTARYLHQHHITAHLIPGPRLLHAKQVVIDGIICWLGSGNFTAAACAHNHETWCRIESAAFGEKIQNRIREYRAQALPPSTQNQDPHKPATYQPP